MGKIGVSANDTKETKRHDSLEVKQERDRMQKPQLHSVLPTNLNEKQVPSDSASQRSKSKAAKMAPLRSLLNNPE